MRELKENEDYRGLFPIEVEVAFKSEVKIALFMNKRGTIIGPEGTETIVCMSDLAKAGWKVHWTDKRWNRNLKGKHCVADRTSKWTASVTK